MPLTAPRLRWSAAGCLRLGKSSEAVIDALEDHGGSATVEELAAALGTSRARDLRRRVISRLEDRGIVTVDGGLVSLVDVWPEALQAERENAGEVEKARLDATKFEREREAWREKVEADTAPSVRDMDEYRTSRPALAGDALRAYRVLNDSNTRPGIVYTVGADAECLAGALAAHFGEAGPADPAAWKRWLDPVAQALVALDGVATGAAA